MLMASNGYGAMRGARNASPRRTTTMAAPTQSLAGTREEDPASIAGTAGAGASTSGSAIVDLRIEHGVEEVRDEVGHAVDRRDHKDTALDEWQVMALNREHDEASEPGIREHRLDDDDAADQPT